MSTLSISQIKDEYCFSYVKISNRQLDEVLQTKPDKKNGKSVYTKRFKSDDYPIKAVVIDDFRRTGVRVLETAYYEDGKR